MRDFAADNPWWSIRTSFACARRAMRLVAVTASFALLAVTSASGKTVDPPVSVTVIVPGDPRPTRLMGKLLAYDENTFTIDVLGEQITHRWGDVLPGSAFSVRLRTIDQKKASDWLALGKLAWGVGETDRAEIAFDRAVGLDGQLQPEVDRIRALDAGWMRTGTAGPDGFPQSSNPGPEPAQAENAAPDEEATSPESGLPPLPPLPGEEETGAPTIDPGSIEAPPAGSEMIKPGGAEQLTKYHQATPEEHAAAIEQARADAKAAGEHLGITFREIQTDHFIIFTDWDPREDKFLSRNLEKAYRLVSGHFDIPSEENVFVGKLPVYMFELHSDFLRHLREIDQFPAPSSVSGIYVGKPDGRGKLLMPKPAIVNGDVRAAERQWARVLTHEFTHAFLARYKSNAFIPRWLNEGIAEIIAEPVYPQPQRRWMARRIAKANISIAHLFDDQMLPSGEYYPVMMTLVEGLVMENRRAFIRMVDDIKNGTPPERALHNHFNVSYRELEVAWRQWQSAPIQGNN